MKGTRYVVLSRRDAEFMVKSAASVELFNWLALMANGDESFFSTLATLKVGGNGTIEQDVSRVAISVPTTVNQKSIGT